MFYKVLKEGRVIDVLDHLIYLKWDSKHGIMVLCGEDEAQAFLSSDGNTVWHERTFYRLPVNGYDEVELEEIDQYEYKELKMLNGQTKDDLVDSIILHLLETNVI